jgi:recombination protein RecR
MNSIDRLSELFKTFPGIGPRQARRFVYHLLSRNGSFNEELVKAIESLRQEITQCSSCFRHFAKSGGENKLCRTCADPMRDNSLLLVVSRDVDLETVEKSGGYEGRYFVLGGVVPILDKEPEKRVRIEALKSRLDNDKEVKEVILAMNANLDGEHTADYIREYFHNSPLTFSILGRGLSTGAELEYVDPETFKNALKNRSH